MKPNIDTIKKVLYEEYPDYDVDKLVKHYFSFLKSTLSKYEKPEITIGYLGRFVVRTNNCLRHLKKLERRVEYNSNWDNPYFDKQDRQRKIDSLVLKRDKLLNLIKLHIQMNVKGKTQKSVKKRERYLKYLEKHKILNESQNNNKEH